MVIAVHFNVMLHTACGVNSSWPCSAMWWYKKHNIFLGVSLLIAGGDDDNLSDSSCVMTVQ